MKNLPFKCLFVAVVTCLLSGCSPEARKARSLERARNYYSAGEFEKAKIEYLNAFQIDPQSSVATEGLGLVWFEQGAMYRALPLLLRASTQMPGNHEVRKKLALALAHAGRIEDARNEALKVVEQAAAPDEAFILLADTIRSPADFDATAEAIKKSARGQGVWGQVASAKLLFRKADLTGAAALLQRALNSDPKSAIVHSALADLQMQQGNQTKAREELKQAATLAPVRSTTRMRFAEDQVRTNSLPEAIAYLKDLVHQAPDYLPPKLLLSQIALVQKRFDDAQALLKEIFTVDSSNIEGHLLEAQISVVKGEVKKAIEELEALRKSVRGIGAINFQLARIYLMDGHPDRAVAVLEEGVGTHPEYVDSIILLAELKLQAGQAQAVVNLMVGLLRRQPGIVQAQTLLVNGLRSLGRLDDAAATVREQIRVMPKSAQPQVLLGTILVQQKNLEGAKAAFEKAQELAPDYLPGLAALVDLDLREKKYDSALRRVQDKKATNPTMAELPYIEATIYIAQKMWDNAEAALQKAIEINPGFSNAYDLLLNLYAVNKKLPDAIRQLENTLAKQPNDLRALLFSGIIYSQMNDYAKAKTAYEKALAVRPESTMALNNLAYLYSENLNQLDRAAELANKAHALDPESPGISDTLGWILFKLKEYPRALELIRDCAAKMPDNPEVQFHLGMASQMVGQNDMARTAFQRAASSPAEFPGKSEIKNHLAALPAETPKAPPAPGGDNPAK